MSIKRGIIVDLVMIAIIGIVGFVYLNFIQDKQQNRTTISATPSIVRVSPPSTTVALPDPASVNCTKEGGILAIEKRIDGATYGLCQCVFL